MDSNFLERHSGTEKLSSIESIHDQYVSGRRVRVLADHLAALLPDSAHILDVGCGDGLVGRAVMDRRPDVQIEGIDVLMRPRAAIPIMPFDGAHIPHADRSIDTVMFVDVLHHTPDPLVLLREAVRVSRIGVLLKDHTCEGIAARLTLRFMDQVGNARYGVALPHNYWRLSQWQAAFGELSLRVETWISSLHLYPWWADWWFGRGLHFIAFLHKQTSTGKFYNPTGLKS